MSGEDGLILGSYIQAAAAVGYVFVLGDYNKAAFCMALAFWMLLMAKL